jgi:hypothetical protein
LESAVDGERDSVDARDLIGVGDGGGLGADVPPDAIDDVRIWRGMRLEIIDDDLDSVVRGEVGLMGLRGRGL